MDFLRPARFLPFSPFLPNEYTAVPGLIEGEDDWMTAAIGYARFGDVLNHEANDSVGVALKWEM